MNQTLYEKATKTDFKKVLDGKGYQYFQNGKFNLNLIGIRANRPQNKNEDIFADVFVCIYKNENDKPTTAIIPITTVPGVSYLKNPSNKKGTAILKPGQYKGVWKIDLHAGKYPALCQRGDKFIVYRDSNRDLILDFNEATAEYGYFGINFHKAGENSQTVGSWSAGCQVCQKIVDFDLIMNLANKAKTIWGNSFTYTLLTESDLI